MQSNKTLLETLCKARSPANPTVDTECEVQDVASPAEWWSDPLTDGPKCL